MKMDFKSFVGWGFRYGKFNVDYLIGCCVVNYGYIYLLDFGDFLYWYGIELIIDYVEMEL